MRRIAQLLLLPAVLTVTLAACGGGDASGPDPRLTVGGTYALQSIDGVSLPYVVPDTNGTATSIEVRSGTLTLGAAGALSVATTFHDADGAQESTVTCSGSWSGAGSSLNLTLAGAGACAGVTVPASVTAANGATPTTLTIAWAATGPGRTSVYTREE